MTRYPRRGPRGFIRALTLRPLIAAAILAAGTLGAATTAQAATAPACRPAVGPFHQHGAKITQADGSRYTPYGLNIVGISQQSWTGHIAGDLAAISAAAQSWCANTVRLQVSQDNLVSAAGTVNSAFLAAIEQEVSQAKSVGLVAVLNDQTQLDSAGKATENMPTSRSKAFWAALTSVYGHDPQVMFDLFNEPHNVGSWARWRNGYRSAGVRYYGLQQLASYVRGKGSRNVFWIEGPGASGSLARVAAYQLAKVGPLMYAEHRPSGPHTAARWNHLFGYLSAGRVAPVLDGEWADYARANAPWACWADSRTSVPRWLKYLASVHAGLIVTRLSRGELIESANLADPTRLRSDFACRNGLDEGAGRQVMSWFQRQNG